MRVDRLLDANFNLLRIRAQAGAGFRCGGAVKEGC